jgi:dihydroflavonol-4-reductase
MILVTGATGHSGNVLIRELLSRGNVVRALIQPGEELTPLEGLDVEIFEADVLDAQALCHSFQDIDQVYHLAGIISIMPGSDNLLKLVNVLGTRNVLHAARLAGVKRLVYISSIHAIRRVPHGITIDESIPFDPVNAHGSYDYSKALASLDVLEAAHSGLNAVGSLQSSPPCITAFGEKNLA